MNTYYTPAPHEPWFDDSRPSAQPIPHRSAALSGRNMALIALGTAGLGIAAGLFALSSQDESPVPAGYVIVPESGDPQASQPEVGPETAPNVAVPPAVSRNGGVIVQVPPPASTGSRGNSTAESSGPGQQDPGQKTNPDTEQGPDKKKDDTDQGPDKKNDDPFVPPPDVVGPLKDGSDVFTDQPDVFDRPTGPVKGTGDIYQVPPPVIDCTLGVNCETPPV